MKYYYLFRWNAYSGLIPIDGNSQPCKNLPSLELYTPIEMVRLNAPKPKRLGGDLVNFSPIIVSQHFKEAMESILIGKGQFYPIITKGEKELYWIYQVENIIDALDFEKSNGFPNPWYPEKSSTKYTALRSFAINREKLIIDPIIFQPSQYKGEYTFVSESFIDKVRKSKLSGVAIVEENIDWLNSKPIIINK